MKLLGPVILVLLELFLAVPVFAQDTASQGFVSSLIARDDPSLCDDIGTATLPAEYANNTVDVYRQGACHRGVGATLFASCVEPYPHTGTGQATDPPAGQTYIICRPLVMKSTSEAVVVDPADFFVAGDDADRHDVQPAMMEQVPEVNRLRRTELVSEDAFVHGLLVFQAPAEMTRPFALVWWPGWPDTATDTAAAAIVIDRTVPWEEAATINS